MSYLYDSTNNAVDSTTLRLNFVVLNNSLLPTPLLNYFFIYTTNDRLLIPVIEKKTAQELE